VATEGEAVEDEPVVEAERPAKVLAQPAKDRQHRGGRGR